MYTIVGLGNPGNEYYFTRHNAGKLALDALAKADIRSKILKFESYMNQSGAAVAKAIKSKKAAEKLVVIHDDLDLPIGSLRICFNRGSGGHRGVESIVKALKTEGFIRIRLGISPVTAGGKLKKPKGEQEVEKFILTEFKKPEFEILKKVFKRVVQAVEILEEEGLQSAMSKFN